MKFCTKCGASIGENQKFCTKCGHVVGSLNTTNQTQIVNENKNTNFASEKTFAKREISKNTKYGIIAIVLVLILGFSLFKLGKSLTNPTRLVNKLEKALASNNKKAVAELVKIEGVKVDDKNIESFIKYLNEDNNNKLRIIEDLREQAKKIEIKGNVALLEINKKDNIYIDKVGNKFIFFPNYKIRLKPVFFAVSVHAKDATVTLNGVELTKSNAENYTKEFGPYVPGVYNFVATYKGKYANIDDKVYMNTFTEYDTILEDNKFDVQLLDELVFINFQSDYEDAELYVNGQATGVKIKDAHNFGPLSYGTKVYAKTTINGKEVKSDEYTIENSGIDQYNEMYISFYDALQKIEQEKSEIRNLIDGYTRNLCDAVNENWFSYLEYYLYPGSQIYEDQKKYVASAYEKGIREYIKAFEILSYTLSDDKKTGTINTEETYDIGIYNPDTWTYESKGIKTFRYTYTIRYNEKEQRYQLDTIKETK